MELQSSISWDCYCQQKVNWDLRGIYHTSSGPKSTPSKKPAWGKSSGQLDCSGYTLTCFLNSTKDKSLRLLYLYTNFQNLYTQHHIQLSFYKNFTIFHILRQQKLDHRSFFFFSAFHNGIAIFNVSQYCYLKTTKRYKWHSS